MMGVTPEMAVKVMKEKEVDACGANCTLSPSDMIDLVKEFRMLAHLPLIFQPNAGKPKIVDDKTVYEPIPDLEESLSQIISSGADIVGGCCGTDSQYINVLRRLLN
jgi:5-methyltetrahydrofolate--homocysteine methyltransferase